MPHQPILHQHDRIAYTAILLTAVMAAGLTAAATQMEALRSAAGIGLIMACIGAYLGSCAGWLVGKWRPSNRWLAPTVAAGVFLLAMLVKNWPISQEMLTSNNGVMLLALVAGALAAVVCAFVVGLGFQGKAGAMA